MTKNSINLQDSFLNQVRRDGHAVVIVLTSGVQFEGVVVGFDNFTVLVNTADEKRLVYKHAVAQFLTKCDAEGSDEDSGEAVREGAPASADSLRGGCQDALKKTPSPEKPQGFNTLDLSSVRLGGAARTKN